VAEIAGPYYSYIHRVGRSVDRDNDECSRINALPCDLNNIVQRRQHHSAININESFVRRVRRRCPPVPGCLATVGPYVFGAVGRLIDGLTRYQAARSFLNSGRECESVLTSSLTYQPPFYDRFRLEPIVSGGNLNKTVSR